MVLPARTGGVKSDSLHKRQLSESAIIVTILVKAAVYAVPAKGAGNRVTFAVPAVIPHKGSVVAVVVDGIDAQLGHLVHQEGLVNGVAVGVFRAARVIL